MSSSDWLAVMLPINQVPHLQHICVSINPFTLLGDYCIVAYIRKVKGDAKAFEVVCAILKCHRIYHIYRI